MVRFQGIPKDIFLSFYLGNPDQILAKGGGVDGVRFQGISKDILLSFYLGNPDQILAKGARGPYRRIVGAGRKGGWQRPDDGVRRSPSAFRGR